MTRVIIAKFKLREGKASEWEAMNKTIQEAISSAPGFVSRETGRDSESNHYCIVRFTSAKEHEEYMKIAQEKFADGFKAFSEIIDGEMEKFIIDNVQ